MLEIKQGHDDAKHLMLGDSSTITWWPASSAPEMPKPRLTICALATKPTVVCGSRSLCMDVVELYLYPLPLPVLASFELAFPCSFNFDVRIVSMLQHRIMRTEVAKLRGELVELGQSPGFSWLIEGRRGGPTFTFTSERSWFPTSVRIERPVYASRNSWDISIYYAERWGKDTEKDMDTYSKLNNMLDICLKVSFMRRGWRGEDGCEWGQSWWYPPCFNLPLQAVNNSNCRIQFQIASAAYTSKRWREGVVQWRVQHVKNEIVDVVLGGYGYSELLIRPHRQCVPTTTKSS